ncbi:MAG TPA: D-alanyl-D-alanine carboxypeptidase family protein, partial [Hyphomicrobiaceae bacterium]|nr:D-alanyl-D-alanine carboxypeptidase family protein [Hyphomicrobiaceae bacterium]
ASPDSRASEPDARPLRGQYGMTGLPQGILCRQLLSALIAAMLAFVAPTGSGALAAEQSTGADTVAIKAPHAILMDADTGAIMFQRAADELIYPASMSKLMTLAVAFKAIKAGEIKLEDEFFMSEYAWRKGGAPSGTSAMMVPVGKKAKLEELLKGITVQSGNDAAISIAENMAGNESLFVKRMNAEARQIGLKKSSFTNPTGLHDPGHQMTARELAILARHIIRTYPDLYELFALKEFNYLKHRFINRNPLLGQVAGLDGLKTGFTKEAGNGIVASAKQDGRRLIAVVAGDATADERRDDARRLLEWGFRAFAETKLFDAGEIVGHARVWGGQRMYVPLSGKGDINVWLPRNMGNQKLRANIVYQWPLKPPLKKGDQVAVLRVTTSSETMNEVPLFVAEDVEQAGPMRRGFDSILCLATRWLP